MAFEKMTTGALYDEFVRLFPDVIGDQGDGTIVTKFNKVGARMLRIELNDDRVLYFLWYDETNWNLGTKPYRNQPRKQQYAKMRKKLKTENTFNDLKKGVENLPPETNLTMEEAILQMKFAEAKALNEGFRELKTKSNDVITSCNQTDPGKEFVDAFIKCVKLAANPDVEAASIAYLASLGGVDSKDIDPKAFAQVIREAGVVDLDNPKCPLGIGPIVNPEELTEKVRTAVAKPDSEDEIPEGSIHVTVPRINPSGIREVNMRENNSEPIDWIKDDPDMFEKGIRVTQEHPEWDDVIPMGETASTVDI